MKPTKVHSARKRDKRRKEWGDPILNKLMKLKYSINDAYHSGYDDVVRDPNGIDDKNYVMSLITDIRKHKFTKLSPEDGHCCNRLWELYSE